MALKKKLSCLSILTLCLAACKLSKAADEIPKLPSINNPKFIREFVDHHNELRGKVNPTAADMNSLSWDKALAEVARAWAKRCLFSHNPCTGKRYGCISGYDYIGENIYLGGIKTEPRQVVYAWYNESKDYDFDNKSCSKTCGHYTQVVWAKSLKVGCAVANCPHLLGNSAGLFVCNYSPAGNYKDMNPYTKGKPCSMCGKDDCMDNLCLVLTLGVYAISALLTAEELINAISALLTAEELIYCLFSSPGAARIFFVLHYSLRGEASEAEAETIISLWV